MSEADDLVRRRFRIRGRVQGVGFRWWAREQATRLGLDGWIRNCADGTVEAQAQGAASEVDRFQALLRQGPPGSQVHTLQSFPGEHMEEPGFRILR